jgi:hypothetical protein
VLAFKAAFVSVLQLAHHLCLSEFGTVGRDRWARRKELGLRPASAPGSRFLGFTHCYAQVRPKWRQPFA